MDIWELLQYGLWTAVVFWIVAPIINKLFKQQEAMLKSYQEQSEKRHTAITKGFESMQWTMSKGFEKIQTSFKEHAQEDHEDLGNIHKAIETHHNAATRSFNHLAMSIGSTVLTEEQATNMLLEKMWFVSRWKLDYIRTLLEKNHIYEKEESLKLQIKAELEKKSKKYYKDFWEFSTPAGNLSRWLDEHFTKEDFEDFLQKIYKAFFKQYDETKFSKQEIIDIKINEIAAIMQHLQNTLASILQAEMDWD